MIKSGFITPTLYVALEIQPTTGNAETYDIDVIIDDAEEPEEFHGLVFDVVNDYYFISGIGPFPRGSHLKITAKPSDGAVSEEFELTCEPETSRSATIRQRLYELITDADIHFQGVSVLVLGDVLGRPVSLHEDVTIGEGRVAIEIGVAYPTAEIQEYIDSFTQTVNVPIRMYVPADDPDEAEWLVAVAERVRAATTGVNWNLNDMGVVNLAWSWSGEAPQRTPDNKLIYLQSTISVSVFGERGSNLYV